MIVKKEVCLVSAYTPDSERTELLRDLIKFLHKNNKEIVLISHTHDTPSDIIDRCKYFIYSSENILINDSKYRMFVTGGNSEIDFGTKINIDFKNTILATYNMFFLGLNFCKNLNYEVIHYIEYDCKFESVSLLDFSYKKITEGFDSFIIEDEKKELFGGFLSLKSSSFDPNEIEYDEEKIRRWTEELFVAEKITKKYILGNKKNYVLPYNDIKNFNFFGTTYKHTQSIEHLSFPAIVDNNIKYVHCNFTPYTQEILIIINNEHLEHKLIDSMCFHIFQIGEISNTKNVKVLVDEKSQYFYDMTNNELLDNLKKNSYLN